MPIISMPIDLNHTEEIEHIMLSKNVPEEEMKEHVSEKNNGLFGILKFVTLIIHFARTFFQRKLNGSNTSK